MCSDPEVNAAGTEETFNKNDMYLHAFDDDGDADEISLVSAISN